MWLKAFAVFLLIALLETVHGILRVRFLNRLLGDHRARQFGVFTGSALILTVAWVTVPWLALADTTTALKVGGAWLAGMLAFEIGVGRVFFRASWARIGAEFDVRRGGLLGFGMLVLALAPWLVGHVRGAF